jgi:hypothetical protein
MYREMHRIVPAPITQCRILPGNDLNFPDPTRHPAIIQDDGIEPPNGTVIERTIEQLPIYT